MSDYAYQIPPGVDRAEFMRSRVFVERDRVTNTADTAFPGTWSAYDDSWDFEKWAAHFRMDIHRVSPNSIEFDMVGVHATVANTLRRILIASVPSMAFEDVYVWSNTGIMTDEILSHRLGLIPIRADVTKFGERTANDQPTDLNTLVFNLNVRCERNAAAPANAPLSERLINRTVTSGMLVWEPQGDQAVTFANDPIRPAFDDIVITKLNEGESLTVVLHARKGIGRDHAKFSPVGTASYRILPEIHLLRPIVGDEAIKFQKCFPEGVIALDTDPVTKQPVARVADARRDTVSREALRHPEFQDAVSLSRVRDHFIFQVESTGAMEPQLLLVEAFKVLKSKALKLRAEHLLPGFAFASSRDSPWSPNAGDRAAARHNPQATNAPAAMAQFRALFPSPDPGAAAGPEWAPPAVNRPLPWSLPVAVRLARTVSHRLLAAAAPRSGDDDGVPTFMVPSPVWSPWTGIHAEWEGVAWTDVHRLYQHIVHHPDANPQPRRESSRAPPRVVTVHDTNLALYAFHQSLLASSDLATTSARVLPHLLRRGTPLSTFPDTVALGVYHATRAHRDLAAVHLLVRDRLEQAGGGGDAVQEAAMERAVHALLVGLAHGGYPVRSIARVAEDIAPWLAGAGAEAARARFLSTVLFLVVHHPEVQRHAPGAGRAKSGGVAAIDEARKVVARLLDQLATLPWTATTYHSVLTWAVAVAGDRTLVPFWAAEMRARGIKWSLATHNLMLRDTAARVAAKAAVATDKAETPATEPPWWTRLRTLWRQRRRSSPTFDSPLADPRDRVWRPLLSALRAIPRPNAESYAIVVTALADGGHVSRAWGVFHEGVAAGAAPVAAVPAVLDRLLDANRVHDALGLLVTLAEGSGDAGDEVARVLLAHAARIRRAVGGPPPVAQAGRLAAAAALKHMGSESGDDTGAHHHERSWTAALDIALAGPHIDLLRALLAWSSPAPGWIPPTHAGAVLEVLGSRGLASDAAAVIRAASRQDRGANRLALEDAFARGAARLGAQAQAGLTGELRVQLLSERE
ncbi:DNA-directed RNA polymerase core subunit rpc40 [Blastocladiella emersonii ATCC 22665]|nr:DNA-directed RNA polymerase core subunit rpc40 [Blastocladiella emersonii ATCC 22665]